MDLCATQNDYTNALAVARQRNGQDSAVTELPRAMLGVEKSIPLPCEEIVHMHRSPFDDGQAGRRIPVDRQALARNRDIPMMSAELQIVAALKADHGIVGTAELANTLYDRLQHRYQVSGGGCDHLEDITAASLVSESFREIVRPLAQLAHQPRVLDCDHSLRSKLLEQQDLFF